MGTTTTSRLREVAIVTQHLKAWRIRIVLQPPMDLAFERPAVLGAIVVHVVDRKKFLRFFTATRAARWIPAIMLQRGVPGSLVGPLMEGSCHFWMLGKIPSLTRAGLVALGTELLFPSSANERYPAVLTDSGSPPLLRWSGHYAGNSQPADFVLDRRAAPACDLGHFFKSCGLVDTE
jgi:hypothetical protein